MCKTITYWFTCGSTAGLEKALGQTFYPQVNIISTNEKSDLEETVKSLKKVYKPKFSKNNE